MRRLLFVVACVWFVGAVTVNAQAPGAPGHTPKVQDPTSDQGAPLLDPWNDPRGDSHWRRFGRRHRNPQLRHGPGERRGFRDRYSGQQLHC